VKAGNLEQLWSAALLYARDGKKGAKKVGSSILERLLANDRCEEQCRFRLVTRRPAVEELRVLEAPLGTAARGQESEKMRFLCERLEENLGGPKGAISPKGHGPTWWAQHTVLEAAHSEESLQNHNLRLVGQAVDASGRFLASDQRQQLYDLVLVKVKAAADADKSINRDAGKLVCRDLADWFDERVRSLERGGSEAGGRALREKLRAAGISEATVASAEELRRSYRHRWLQPSYLSRDKSRAWEDRIRAELVELRSRLDSAEINEPGVVFHNRTLAALERVRSEAAEGEELPKDFFQGCMYYITDVCQHRFLKAEV
jgi:hypothetical protein